MHRRFIPMPLLFSGILLAALGVFATMQIDAGLKKGLEKELRRLEGQFESKTGFSLQYASLSPSILTGLVARDLVIGSPNGGRVLVARKVAIRFEIASLLRGEGGAFISSITVEGADATFDSATIDKIAALLRPGGSTGSGSLYLPPVRIEGRDIRVALHNWEGASLDLGIRHLDLDSRNPTPSLNIDGTLTGTMPSLGDFSATANASGFFSTALDAARLRVKISGSTGDFALSRQDFDIALGHGRIELRKVRDSSPIDLYARYDLGTEDLAVNLHSDAFRPARLFAPSGRLAFLAPWFQEAWSTSFDFSLRKFDLATLHYDGKISGSLPKKLAGTTWDVALDASGGYQAIAIRNALAASSEGIFRFSGKVDLAKRLIDGRLDANANILDGRLPLKVSLDVAGSSGTYRIVGKNLEVGGIGFGQCSADLGIDRKGTSGTFRVAVDLPPSRPGSGFDASTRKNGLSAEGTVAWGRNPLLESSISFGSVDGAVYKPILAAFLDEKTVKSLASLSFSGSTVFRSDFSHVSWSTNDLVLKSRILPGFVAAIQASGSDQDVRLRDSTLTYGSISAQLSGDASIDAKGLYSFGATILYSGVTYNLKGTWIGGAINIKGDYGLSIAANQGEAGLIGSVALGSFPLPFAGFPVSVSGDADFRFASVTDWSLALSRLSVIPSSLGGAVPGFACSGTFNPQGGEIVSARLFDRVSTVSGRGRFLWNSGAPGIELELGSASAEHYRIAASLAGGELAAEVDFGSSPLSRFVQQRLVGSVDGKLRIAGPLDAPTFTYQLALRQAKLDDAPIELRLAGAVGKTGYSLSDGLLQWQGFTISKLQAGFVTATGKGSVAGHFSSALILAGSSFDFTMDMASRVSHPSDPLGALSDMLIRGATTNFTYNALQTASWPFIVDLSPRGTFMRGGPGDDFVLSLAADGSFIATTKAPFPILIDGQGSIRGNRIEAEAHGLSIDMAMLVALTGPLPVTFKGGKLSGDLMISGPLADPEFSGALQMTDCELSMPGWINETAGPVTAPVVVDGKRLLLQAPSVPILNSHFGLDFELDFEGWVPTGVKVALKSLPGTRVPLETNILGVAIKGFAVPDIQLVISGPTLAVKGRLTLLDTDIIVTPQTLAQSSNSDSAPQTLLDLDLNVDTARGVHFYFPDRNYPVIAGNVVPGNHLSVRYDQAKDDLSFKGTINARGGDAFYIQRNFFLRSAKIVFNESSGKDFDPLVSMLAELHDSTADGPITVTLRADNQPISVFRPSITSDPPKSESDIAIILGQGLFALDDSGGLNLGRIAIAGSEFVPQLNVTKAFESRIRDALNLDVLYFSSQVVQRWLFSLAGTGTQGLSTLTDYLKETNLFAGKYLSDTVFLHASARLDADPLVPAGSLGIVSDFGVDFETPFGLLQWTFQPAHPGQLFIDDQSLSLSWRLPLK